MRLYRTGLWKHADFVRLWAAESISQLGAQITLIALPLTAALALDASPSQMGMLGAAGGAPFLLLGLFAGVWVDRLRRRPIMVWTDIARAAVLAVVPAAWAFDALRVEMLYAVAFLVGCLTLMFDVAYISYLPTLVRREDLTEGNSRLQASASVAQVAGPGVAGVLVAAITAPLAIVVNVVTYLFSALFVGRIQAHEPPPERHPDPHVLREMGEGLRVTLGNAVLRGIALCGATFNLFGWMFLAVYILYMTRELEFSSFSVGLVFATGGVGALLGAMTGGPAARRFGVGPTIVVARVLAGGFGLLVPLVVLAPSAEVPLVVAAEFLQWMFLVMSDVNAISLRQAIVPHRLQGRVSASFRFLGAGMIPIGSLVGGFLGEAIGLRETLFVGVGGMLLSGLWVYFSPLWRMRRVPEQVEEIEPAARVERVAEASSV
jgi:MFS family permease